MGTPRTLLEAIQNGKQAWIQEFRFRGYSTGEMPDEDEIIEMHIRDFINQKLAVMMLSDDEKQAQTTAALQKLLYTR